VRYLDVCSGYSAFTQAAIGLPFECVGYAEIAAFPSALLGHHYGAGRPRYMPDPDAPDIDAKERKTREKLRKSMASLHDSHFGNRLPNFGDFSQIREDDVGPIDMLIGGTPCQAFSIAGKRLGLDDPRGNLTLEFLALAKRLRVKWVAWENVPGVLSHDDGRTLGTFLGLLGQLGYGWAYRVLDAQYIRVDRFSRAVPQRRKRVIVIGCLGNPAGAAAVLFDRESLRGDSAPRREAWKGVAEPLAAGSPSSSGYRNDADTVGNLIAFGGGNTTGPIDVATTTTSQRLDFDSETFVAHTLRGEGFDASEDGSGKGTPLIAVPFDTTQITSATNRSRAVEGDPCHPLTAHSHPPAVAFRIPPNDTPYETGDITGSLTTGTDNSAITLLQNWRVRRMTPTECERLMGLRDDFTLIPYRGRPASDGPRYMACGNSQAGNMMRWLAHGLADVDHALQPDRKAL